MAEDYTGRTFNSLFVERLIRHSKKTGDMYEVRCLELVEGEPCGNLRIVSGYLIKNGYARMCKECSKKARQRAHNNWCMGAFHAQKEPPCAKS